MKITRATNSKSIDEKLLDQMIRKQDHPIKVNIQGHDIKVENPKGDIRRGTDKDGKKWESVMNNHYGELEGTLGYDGDPIDVFIGPNPNNGLTYVIDQTDENGDFDESKVMLGFDSPEQAKDHYLANYESGWDRIGNITPAGDSFKAWLYDGKKQRKPFSEYTETPNPIEI